MFDFNNITEAVPAAATLPAAALVTLMFAVMARSVRGVTWSGALAGAAVCFAVYFGTGPEGFILLVAVFILTWLATRVGYRRKLALGMAERGEGRTASQVLANLGIAAACALVHRTRSSDVFFLAGCVAALAEATADTVSSEIGQALSSRAYLITTWEPVPAGTDGGITLEGTTAGISAAAMLGFVAALCGMDWPLAVTSAAAGVLGMFADSLIGATLERRNLLNNDTVNFMSTAIAALVAAAFLTLRQA